MRGEPLNIGIIRMRYTPYGGAEVFLSRFIDELLSKGHTCHVFAKEWADGKSEVGSQKSEARNQTPNLIFHKVMTFGPSFLRILSFALNSYFAVKKTPLDAIVSFERTLYQDVYRAGDGCHKEWLMQRRESDVRSQKPEVRRKIILPLKRIVAYINPLHRSILYLEKKLFQSKRLKFVVANSNRGKEEIIRHYGLPEEKICVIYNGIDLKQPCLHDKDKIRTAYREKIGVKNEIALLFVGSGFERKGLKFLIQALAILKKAVATSPFIPFAEEDTFLSPSGVGRGRMPLLKLIVVGKGNIKKHQNMADSLGVGMDVKFMGPVSDVNGYYCAADIFVLPSLYEPFSNACLEAMAGGLPVVTSRINGVSEILMHGKDGMIVEDPANPEEIAEGIKPLLDEKTRQAAGKAARMTVENYGIEKNVDKFLRLIEQML